MTAHTMKDGATSWKDDKGNDTQVANFEARIIEEHKYIDETKSQRHYLIQGIVAGKPTETVLIPAEQFAGMAWPSTAWGSQAIIFPRPTAKDLLRTAIQLESTPKTKVIYTHTGWIIIENKHHYLTNNCAITAKGRTSALNVMLPGDLKHFSFPEKIGANAKDAIAASINLASIATKEVGWAMLAATYRSVIGPSDFSIHITGRTGTFKSELAALAQSHWGDCTARQLPASWSSTGNALEALAYRAKDALLVCDDFIPTGTSWQVKSYQKTADQLIRAQGNQQGRARLTDRSLHQQTMYPRGLILSTGEDTPEGHSVRGRMLIGELSPGDVDVAKLSAAQQARCQLPEAMALFLQWMANDLPAKQKHAQKVAEEIRDENLSVGHSRTPATLGELMSAVQLLMMFCTEQKLLTMKRANGYYNEAADSIGRLAQRQIEYLIAADPADQFMGILRSIFAANAGHIRAKNGGIPKKALLLGWTSFGDGSDLEFKPHGPRLGWSDPSDKTIYLDAAVAYDTIRRHSRGAITITRQTLYKRLREAGFLTRIDDSRQRNTIRVQLENASRQVLALNATHITEGDPD